VVEKQSHHREKLLHVCELVMKVLLEEVRRRSLRQAGPESLLADPRGRWTAHIVLFLRSLRLLFIFGKWKYESVGFTLGTRRIPRCSFDALQKFQLGLLRRNVPTDTSGLENS